MQNGVGLVSVLRVAQTELTAVVSAPSVDFPALAERQRVLGSRDQGGELDSLERPAAHFPRFGGDAPARSQAELAPLVRAPRPDRPGRAQCDHEVRSRGNVHNAVVRNVAGHEDGKIPVPDVSDAELPVAVSAPGVDASPLREHDGEGLARGGPDDGLPLRQLHGNHGLARLVIPDAELAVLVAAKGVEDSLRRENEGEPALSIPLVLGSPRRESCHLFRVERWHDLRLVHVPRVTQPELAGVVLSPGQQGDRLGLGCRLCGDRRLDQAPDRHGHDNPPAIPRPRPHSTANLLPFMKRKTRVAHLPRCSGRPKLGRGGAYVRHRPERENASHSGSTRTISMPCDRYRKRQFAFSFLLPAPRSFR